MRRLSISLAREMLCKFLDEFFWTNVCAATRFCLHRQNPKTMKRDKPNTDATAMATMTDVANAEFDTPSGRSKRKGYPKKEEKVDDSNLKLNYGCVSYYLPLTLYRIQKKMHQTNSTSENSADKCLVKQRANGSKLPHFVCAFN